MRRFKDYDTRPYIPYGLVATHMQSTLPCLLTSIITRFGDRQGTLTQLDTTIPRILHVVCIGAKHCQTIQPVIRMWTRLNPHWKLMTWDSHNYHTLPNAGKLKYKMTAAGMADVLRMSAVYSYGGMYFDTDVVPILPIHEWADLKLSMLNVCNEKEGPQSFMTNAWFAAPPKHPTLKLAVDRMARMTQSDFSKPPNETTGPFFFGRVLRDSPAIYNQLPTVRIYPWPWGQPAPSKQRIRELTDAKQAYTIHMWSHSWGPHPRNTIDTMASLGFQVP